MDDKRLAEFLEELRIVYQILEGDDIKGLDDLKYLIEYIEDRLAEGYNKE